MKVTLGLTHDCNLACSYCYVGAKRQQAMPLDTARKIVGFGFATVLCTAPECQLGPRAFSSVR